jgi:D-glycero-D-manno-heptose 1,7-bisphosphate phosphatase
MSIPAISCYIERSAPPGVAPRAAVFLDRDGVITEETGYLHRPEDVRFLPGAIDSIKAINRMGLPAVLITNQSGIGRGYYEWPDFDRVQSRIRQELSGKGAWLDAEWACGYYPSSKLEFPPDASRYRKPNIGMIQEAAAALSLSLPHSWLVGDKPSDIETAIHAGLYAAVHVLTGYGAETRAAVVQLARLNPSSCQIHLIDSISDLPSLLP